MCRTEESGTEAIQYIEVTNTSNIQKSHLGIVDRNIHIEVVIKISREDYKPILVWETLS